MDLSRPVWGAWIEMGMRPRMPQTLPSRPVWGAWIEMSAYATLCPHLSSRAPYGARGLKFELAAEINNKLGGRAPYGARGLKLALTLDDVDFERVAPRMGRVD